MYLPSAVSCLVTPSFPLDLSTLFSLPLYPKTLISLFCFFPFPLSVSLSLSGSWTSRGKILGENDPFHHSPVCQVGRWLDPSPQGPGLFSLDSFVVGVRLFLREVGARRSLGSYSGSFFKEVDGGTRSYLSSSSSQWSLEVFQTVPPTTVVWDPPGQGSIFTFPVLTEDFFLL